MKGIVLAGGSGTRLYPITQALSKQLLIVYDKPVVYYPLSILMLAGIRDILIISTPRDIPMIESLLGSGEQFGLRLSYKVQDQPKGIAQAFLIAEDFIEEEPVCLILGDNLFHGGELKLLLTEAASLNDGACVFGYRVTDPERFGVVEFDKQKKVLSIEEKPKIPKSNWAVTGLYFYDSKVVELTKKLKPSARGELEITDLNRLYLERGKLSVKLFGRGVAWLDMGTPDSLLSSSIFVQTLEKRQGLKISCPEEIAYQGGFIDKKQLQYLAELAPGSDYCQYLQRLMKE